MAIVCFFATLYVLMGLGIAILRPFPVSKLIFVKTVFLWLPAFFSDAVFIYMDTE